MPVIPGICTQYVEQAAFLWSQRDRAVIAPTPTLQALATLDERLEAHLDGLRVAGEAGWPFCLETLEEGLGGEVFTAAVIALGAGDAAASASVRTAVAQSPALAGEFVAALGWLSDADFHARIRGFMAQQAPLWRSIGIAACAIRRHDCGAALTRALADPNLQLRRRAARAAGELARLDLVPVLATRLTDEDPVTRFWAAWSLALLGEWQQAIGPLAVTVQTPGPDRGRALQIMARIAAPQAFQHWLEGLPSDLESRRLRIFGLGACGDPAAIPWLIERMADTPALARWAGAAFALITGVDLAPAGLDQPPPGGIAIGPNDDPDEDVTLDADAGLPWPDAQRVAAWWHDHQSDLQPDARYLSGHPVSPLHCWAVLQTGRQHARMAAALELALLAPAQPLFETRAPARRQEAWLVAQ